MRKKVSFVNKKIKYMVNESEYTIIGIDGGGSRTRGIIYRNNKVLAQTISGTTRIGTVGVGESCERLLNIITDLCQQTEIDYSELDVVVIGLAGVWLEEEKKRSLHLLKTLARGQNITINDILITSDAELALEGAFSGGNGVILITGTGSIGVAKVAKDKIFRCGGWGIELDDEGSGAWIGREGLTAIVRALDGRGKQTSLTNVFAELVPSIDLNNPRTIVKAYSERNFEYHNLSPLVMRCAEQNDEVCIEIINRAAYHLLEILEVLQANFKTKPVPVALLGGIIDAKTMLAKILIDRIKANKNLQLVKPKGSPLDGAISLGLKLIEKMDV